MGRILGKVKLETSDKIAIITVNRPEKRNALNYEVRSDIFAAFKAVDANNVIKATILTGEGNSFVAGADIAPMKDYEVDDALQASRHGSDIFMFIENMRCPVIAAINGWALGGGCELALACDLRICSDTAIFGQPEIKLGIIPGYGATFRLPRLIGTGRAKELIYTGRRIDASEAEKIGLVNFVVPKHNLMKTALDLAKKLSNGPAALKYAKEAINKAYDLENRRGVETCLEALCTNLYHCGLLRGYNRIPGKEKSRL